MEKQRNVLGKLAAALALTSILFGCNGVEENKEEKVLRPVRTLTVEAPDLNRVHEFSAVVDASRKADLSFKISGELIEIFVQPGEQVKAGQLIAKLDDKDVRIQLQEAESSFQKANADFKRARDLIKSNTISQADFDQLQAQYNTAKAKLDSAQNSLEYTELKASFEGVIAKRYTEKFQEITAKSPIVALHDLTTISLKISVPETIMIRVQKNNEPPKLTAAFDGIDNEVFPLAFKEVSTQADEVTKTYEVTMTMEAPLNHNILPGMTAKVRAERLFPANEFVASYYLPPKSVLKDSQGNYVYVLVNKGQGVGAIKRVSVKVGKLTTLGMEVYGGISEGDRVLTAGMSKVSDGMEVRD